MEVRSILSESEPAPSGAKGVASAGNVAGTSGTCDAHRVGATTTTMDDHAVEPTLDPAAQDALIDDFYRKYVHMVLYARKGAGSWLDDDELSGFTIYLREPPVICINDEPHGWSVARTRRSLRPGEQLEFGDVTSDQVRRPAHQPPYFRAVRTRRLARR
jgi:hypothetical protein